MYHYNIIQNGRTLGTVVAPNAGAALVKALRQWPQLNGGHAALFTQLVKDE